MKTRMIILALMIVVSVAFSVELNKGENANSNSPFSGEVQTLAERVGS